MHRLLKKKREKGLIDTCLLKVMPFVLAKSIVSFEW